MPAPGFAARTDFFAAGVAFLAEPERAAVAFFFAAEGLALPVVLFLAAVAPRLVVPPFFAAGAAFFTAVNSSSFGDGAPDHAPPKRGAKRPPRHSVGG